MLNFLIILAIFVAVIIGYKTGFNTGFFAIVFAYLIGGICYRHDSERDHRRLACQYNVCYLFRVFVLQLCFI